MLPWISSTLLLLAAAPERYPNPQLLMEAEQLAKLPAEQVRILDARTKADYLVAHVPGAVSVDVGEWSKAVSDHPDAKSWAERLASAGIEPAKPVVVYAIDIREAARLWWILKYLGVPDVRLLDGGWTTWEAAKLPTEKKENKPKVAVAEWKPQRQRLATRDEVLARLKDKSAGILDARTTGEFCGRTKLAERAGAIPGSTHLEWTELLDPKTRKFKAAGQLKQLLEEHQVDLNRPAVTYCQSGGRAAVLAFGLELMGGKQVSNYYKSWSEWGNDKETPVEAGKK